MDRSRTVTVPSLSRSPLPKVEGGGGGVGGVGGWGGGGVGVVMVTVTGVALLVPPAPVQDRLKLVVAVRLVRLWLPFRPLAPFQAELVGLELAVQAVALVEDQVMVLEPPELKLVGLAERETVGGLAAVLTEMAGLVLADSLAGLALSMAETW